MGSAYTPGLKVARRTIVEATRRLPIRGKVLCNKGDRVKAGDIVARAELPGDMETVRLNEVLGVEPSEVEEYLRFGVGDEVEKGDLLAEISAFFGLFTARAEAPCSGRIDFFSTVTGHLGVRKPPVPIDVNAYIDGEIAGVLEGEGVVVRTVGAMIQGIFGVGGEGQGKIRMCTDSPDKVLEPGNLPEDLAGQVAVGGSLARIDTFRRAAELGAVGLVTGGIIDVDLAEYLGYDLGVAITGHEDVPFTLIATEGFGTMAMARRTFDLLSSLEGRIASINGATQIRAGAMRPEIIIPDEDSDVHVGDEMDSTDTELSVGTPIRVIRVPYFGKLGEVVELPPELVTLESGSKVRVLRARLADGEVVTVPRANVEIIRPGSKHAGAR